MEKNNLGFLEHESGWNRQSVSSLLACFNVCHFSLHCLLSGDIRSYQEKEGDNGGGTEDV